VNTSHDRLAESLDGSSDPARTSAESALDVAGGTDPLSDVLETVRLRGALFFVWEPSWHYATRVPEGSRFGGLILPGAERIVSYHIVTEGPCWGAVIGEDPVRLETGDILLLPHGDAYCIASRPSAATPAEDPDEIEFFRRMAAGEIPPVVVDGGGRRERNRIICGFLGCERLPFNPLLDTLPRLIRVPAAAGPDPLAGLVGFALDESGRGQEGERCLLLRLSEVMFVEVLRRYLRSAPAQDSGWLVALRDPLVGRALGLLHRTPEAPWTLGGLGAALATSRSTLSERFAEAVGEPPMQYLARWRMQLAARRLADGPDKVYAIARAVGYQTEAAFSRAFKRRVGVSPSAWRRGARGTPEAWAGAGRGPAGQGYSLED